MHHEILDEGEPRRPSAKGVVHERLFLGRIHFQARKIAPLFALGGLWATSEMYLPNGAAQNAPLEHKILVPVITGIAIGVFFLHGKRTSINNAQLEDLHARGELEPVLRQMLAENPQQRENILKITEQYGITLEENESSQP